MAPLDAFGLRVDYAIVAIDADKTFSAQPTSPARLEKTVDIRYSAVQHLPRLDMRCYHCEYCGIPVIDGMECHVALGRTLDGDDAGDSLRVST